MRRSFNFTGQELDRTGKFSDPRAVLQFIGGRQFPEAKVRQRVPYLPDVMGTDHHDVVELIAASPERVTGVRVVDRMVGAEQDLAGV